MEARRRRKMRYAVLFTAAVVAAAGAVPISALVAPQRPAPRGAILTPTRPNILVIMTDDQRQDDMWVMQRVDALLTQRGTTFSDSFASFPLCCPSRATFLTGQYSHNHGVGGNIPPLGGYGKLDHTETLAVWLERGGYYTAHVGKYLNGYGVEDAQTVPGPPPYEIPPGWSEWYGSVDPFSHTMLGFTLNEQGTLVTYGDQTGAQARCDSHPFDGVCYQTDVYARKAADFIRRRARATDGKPFFLWVAFTAPHLESPAVVPNPRPAPRHRGSFRNQPLPTPPSLNETDVSDKPVFLRSLAPMNSTEIGRVTAFYRTRLTALLAVDDAVDEIIAALGATGQLQNTVVIFASDNGWFQGEHRFLAGKGWPYEEAVRVPLIIRAPGMPAGQTVAKLVANLDLAPTIVDLAQAVPGRVMDGRSLLPLMTDPTAAWRPDLLLKTSYTAAVRSDLYVYMEHISGEREFYDLQVDPFQLQSLHDSTSAAYQAIMAALKQRLDVLKACSGASCW
ncbi:MAG: sulfatase [Candidatus Rokubacteria bacterium]|nr:sulfatase [Candidatus Rokubacteria bacterium]